MKKVHLLFACMLFTSITVLNTSCSKSDDPAPQEENKPTTIEVKTVTSLEATDKVYLNLSTGAYVPASDINATNWDVSFYAKDRSISVGVNSGSEGSGTAGAQIVESGFEDLKSAPEAGYLTGSDATGDYLKWSNYTGGTTEPKHAVLPKPGLTIVVKTADGKYAKIQMLSLYQGNPNPNSTEFADLTTRPAFGYFSFRYATQTNGTRNF